MKGQKYKDFKVKNVLLCENILNFNGLFELRHLELLTSVTEVSFFSFKVGETACTCIMSPVETLKGKPEETHLQSAFLATTPFFPN